jgi:signal transduction histidine kinase
MNTEIISQSSFRKQLTTTFTIGILALAIITSLTTAWITSANVYDQMVEDGLQVTNTVAEQSVLSLLYGSGDNAEDAFNAAMGFPSISHVTLLTTDGSVLLSKGRNTSKPTRLVPKDHEAILAEENSDEWIFVAPVYSEGQIESPDNAIALAQQDESNARELLGTVVVTKSKSKLKKTVTATITNNLGVTVIVAVILLMIVRSSFSRLTQPLSELSLVMGRAELGDADAHAALQGPKEVHNIARAFNKMMEALAERDAQLRRHNEFLEHEVAQRTHDLVYARDMAIQANQNKSDFLSRVSHELRTPLQSILGYSDLIIEELPVEMGELHHDIETIIANANHLLIMINSILDMSKLESGQMQLQLSQVNLRKLISGVVETTTPLLQTNQNRLEKKLKLKQESIVIDEAKLRQIILNLLSNAIKFTHEGLIQLEVICTTELLHLTVKDSGIGMESDQIEHIFDPFYQVESSITRRFQGTGLGLAITYQFCRLMGGTIKVTSHYHQGSTFEVFIPIPIKEARDSADF